jgi:hypothetical protein
MNLVAQGGSPAQDDHKSQEESMRVEPTSLEPKETDDTTKTDFLLEDIRDAHTSV